MIVLTLNQCAGGDKFYPQIEHASTRNGDLIVKVERPGVITADWSLPREGATLKHRFEYQSVTPVIGKTARHGLTYLKLAGFSGAAIKFSDALGKVVAWQFEPLRGHFNTITLDCPVLLDGLE